MGYYENNRNGSYYGKNRNGYGSNDSQNITIFPYNFVPLEASCSRNNSKKGNLTGYIDVSITPKTRLIIPGVSIQDNEFDFYKYDGHYVIPGSQVRGVIRSSYEILTNSCLSQIEDSDLSYRFDFNKSKQPNVESKKNGERRDFCFPAIIKYEGDKWVMYRAKDEKGKISYNLNNFDYINGLIYRRGEKNFKGHSEKLYRQKEKICELNADQINNIKANCKKYDENSSSSKTIYRETLSALNEKKTFVIFYFKENNKFYFTPSQIGRQQFYNSVYDVIKNYNPCSDELCKACSLFGTVSDKKYIASRVRFTDFVFEDKEAFTKNVTLVGAGSHIDNFNLYGIYSWDDKNATIRGRKYYWHHTNYNAYDKVELNDEMKSNYKYLDFNNSNQKSFTGKIYFEDLTMDELKDLIFSIELGENGHMHKLGHGKPFGYGSCVLKCTNVYAREVDFEEARINNVPLNVDRKAWSNYNLASHKEYEKITRFDAVDSSKVSYPIGVETLKNGESRLSVLKGYSNLKKSKFIFKRINEIVK